MIKIEISLLTCGPTGSVLLVLHDAAMQPLSYSVSGNAPASDALCSRLGFNAVLRECISNRYMLGNGHRTYSPGLMRFLSPDRLSPFTAGGINAYGYCGGDPVNFIDAKGTSRSRTGMVTFGHYEGLVLELAARTPHDGLRDFIGNDPKLSTAIKRLARERALTAAEGLPPPPEAASRLTLPDIPDIGIFTKDREHLIQVVALWQKLDVAAQQLDAGIYANGLTVWRHARNEYGEARKQLFDYLESKLEKVRHADGV